MNPHGTFRYDSNSNTLTFFPSAPFAPNKTYLIYISSKITDKSGNAVSSHCSRFRTSEGIRIIRVSPTENKRDVAVSNSISATFSSSINTTTMDHRSFVVQDQFESPVVGNLSYDSSTNTVTFSPADELNEGMMYTVSVSDLMKDTDDTAVVPYSWSFSTLERIVKTKFSWIADVSPRNGSSDIALESPISVTFSKAMSAFTIANNSFILQEGSHGVNGRVSYDSSTNTATFIPASLLKGNTTYTVGLSHVIRDREDTVVVPYSWSFSTVDVTVPKVTHVSPALGSTDVSLSDAILVVFSESMNAISINDRTLIVRDESNHLVSGTVNYDSSTNTATFVPASLWRSKTAYVVSVTDAIENTDNRSIFPYSWSFTTAEFRVTSTSPALGFKNFLATNPISVTFSESVNTVSMISNRFTLKDEGNRTVLGEMSYDSNTKTATFFPSSLRGKTTYTASLDHNIEDIAGNALSAYSWSFTTADIRITNVSPSVGAIHVSVFSPISVIFSESMNATSMNDRTLIVRDESNHLVSGIVSYDSNTKTATFFPSSLRGETTYTVSLSNRIKDSTDHALDAYSWKFTTADMTPPIVTTISPTSGSSDVSVSSPISVTFSKTLDSLTIIESSFSVKDDSNNAVNGTLNYDSNSNTLTFSPASSLRGATTYSATLSNRISDLAGNCLGLYSWSFTTEKAIPAKVTRVFPAFEASNVVLESPISVTFSKPINFDSVSDETFTVIPVD